MRIAIIADQKRVGFLISYNPVLKDRIRQLFRDHRGSWLPGAKAWVVPATAALAVLNGLQRLGLRVQLSELQRQLEQAQHDPDRRMGQAINLSLYPLKQGGGTAIQFAYDRATVTAMHAVLARYHPDSAQKFWLSRISSDYLKKLLADEAGIDAEDIFVSDKPVDIEIFEQGSDNEYSRTDVGRAAQGDGAGELSSGSAREAYMLALAQPLARHAVDIQAVQTIAHSLTLYQHQAEAVRHLLTYSGALLADDMGCGKTRSAIATAKLIGAPTIIVCPASLKLNWQREITEKCRERIEDVCIIDGARSRIRPVPWIILNYENLALLCQSGLPAGFTLIIDEAHYIKEPTAQRTLRAFELAARADRRMLLTATPMLNRPAELYTLLRLSGHPAAEIEFGQFKQLYSRARDLLGRRIAEWMMRRTKDEVLSLPAKVRSCPEITVPDELREEYDRIYHDTALLPIVKLTRLRQALEKMKLPFITEVAESVAESAKVVIFCQYRSSVAALAAQFGHQAVIFTGEETLAERHQAIARFQEPDSQVRYFIGTIDAGGLGITLTAASYVIVASRPFTPSVQCQAEDRCYRLGQSRRVEVIIPTVPSTIDQDLQQLLDEKQSAIEQVLAARLEAQHGRIEACQ
jgi:SNF2 family DNA or RNA helicase